MSAGTATTLREIHRLRRHAKNLQDELDRIPRLLKANIEQVLKTLTYREREIIKLRYGLGDGYCYTLEELGRIFKVTRERIRQIEDKALRKLRHPLRQRTLAGYV